MKKFYSQKGQDRWVIEEVSKGKRGGFFIDLAASDGISGNNTYALEKDYGWKGLCIEANENLFQKLNKNRKCMCLNACIDKVKQQVRFLDNRDMSGIVDFDTDNKPNLIESKYFKLKEIRGRKINLKEVERLQYKIEIKMTLTLDEVLERFKVPKVIDFLSLDVEGAEERILSTFPFKKWKFLSMVIERPTAGLNQLLFDNGYRFVRKSQACNNFDFFYVHESFKGIKNMQMERFSEVDPLESLRKK